jgi:ribosome modulation factor
MTVPTVEKLDPVVQAMADQMRAAFQSGYQHGRKNGARSKDPYLNVDEDLHHCWDLGWLRGTDDKPGTAS